MVLLDQQVALPLAVFVAERFAACSSCNETTPIVRRLGHQVPSITGEIGPMSARQRRSTIDSEGGELSVALCDSIEVE